MSKYTTEVRYICEVAAGLEESKGFNDIESILNNSFDKIFNFSYPSFIEMPEFTEKYSAAELAELKKAFEKKILRHYYTYEIGAETVGLWKLHMQQSLYEIMPYYNKLYASELLDFDPFENVNMTSDSNRSSTSASDSKSENSSYSSSVGMGGSAQKSEETPQSKSTRYDLFSDTPESSLSGVDSERYLTDARKITEEREGTGADGAGDITDTSGEEVSQSSGTAGATESSSGTSTGTDISADHTRGKAAGETYSEMLQKYRSTILNIDQMVLEDLRDCFMYIF